MSTSVRACDSFPFGIFFQFNFQSKDPIHTQTTVRAAIEPYVQYRELYDSVKGYYDTEARAQQQGGKQRNQKSMEDMLFVRLWCLWITLTYHNLTGRDSEVIRASFRSTISLRGVLCLREIEGAGDQKFGVLFVVLFRNCIGGSATWLWWENESSRRISSPSSHPKFKQGLTILWWLFFFPCCDNKTSILLENVFFTVN